MRTKAVILNLRVAKASDFKNELGQKKYGCMYFQQSISGTFCNKPYFFHENTDLDVFRELYNSNQIWVLAGIFDDVEFIEKRKPIIDKNKYGIRRIKERKPMAPRPCFCKQKH
jgi:hypothetical protein